MRFVEQWAREKKTPIPQKKIITEMKEGGTKDFTTAGALTTLLKLGYIRRAVPRLGTSNRTFYVQLRGIR